MTEIKRLIDHSYSELQRNDRLRAGVYIILLVLAVHTLLVQSDRLQGAQQDYQQASKRLDKIHSLQTTEYFQEKLSQEEQSNEILTRRIWNAKSVGIAQAKLGKRVTQLLKPLDVRNPRMQIGELTPVEGVPGLWEVQVNVTAQYRKGTAAYLLGGLEAETEFLMVRRLSLNDRNKRLTMVASAYFRGIKQSPEKP